MDSGDILEESADDSSTSSDEGCFQHAYSITDMLDGLELCGMYLNV